MLNGSPYAWSTREKYCVCINVFDSRGTVVLSCEKGVFFIQQSRFRVVFFLPGGCGGPLLSSLLARGSKHISFRPHASPTCFLCIGVLRDPAPKRGRWSHHVLQSRDLFSQRVSRQAEDSPWFIRPQGTSPAKSLGYEKLSPAFAPVVIPISGILRQPDTRIARSTNNNPQPLT